MKTYTALFAEDVACRSIVTIDAATDGEAIARALAYDWGAEKTDPDYDSVSNRRIVQIDIGSRTIAHDIPLDLDERPPPGDAALRNAARDLFEALQKARFELDFQQKHFPRANDTELRETLTIINAALSKAEGGAP